MCVCARSPDALLGTHAITRIRAVENERRLPRCVIISCTGNASGQIGDAFSLLATQDGANAVWSKPFPSHVNGTMQRELNLLLRSFQQQPVPEELPEQLAEE